MKAKQRAGSLTQELVLREAIGKNPGINIWTDSYMRETIRLLITIALGLGLRFSQILGIKIPDIDFKRKTISVNATKCNGIKIKLLIPDDMAKYINKYINKYRANCSGSKNRDYLFVSKHSQIPLSINTILKALRTLGDEVSGLPGNYSPNLLRSIYINRYIIQPKNNR